MFYGSEEYFIIEKIVLTMEFEGVVYRKMPEVSGTSARGTWKKQDVVFEIPSEFIRKICVTFFGDRAEDAAALREGDAAQVSVNVESREYNGKWYTDVKAWKIVRKDGVAAPSGQSVVNNSAPVYNDAPFNESTAPSPADDVDDLPF
jgi:hypothetical protein